MDATISVERLSLAAEAHGMILSLRSEGMHAYFTALAPQMTSSGQTVLASYIALDRSQIEASDSGLLTRGVSGDAARDLASITFSGIKSHTAVMGRGLPQTWLSQSPVTDAHRPVISALASVEGFDICLLRSMIRIYSFFEEWSAEALPKSKSVFEDLRKDLEFVRPPTSPSSTKVSPTVGFLGSCTAGLAFI